MIDGVSFYAKVRTKQHGFSVFGLGPEQEELQKGDKWLDSYEIRQKDQPILPKFARFKKHIPFTFEGKDWEILVFEAAKGVRMSDLLWDIALRDYATTEEKRSQMASFGKIGKSIGQFHFCTAPSDPLLFRLGCPLEGPFMVHRKLDLYSTFFDSTTGDVTLTNYEELYQTANGFDTERDFQRIFHFGRDFAHFVGKAHQQASLRYQKDHPYTAPENPPETKMSPSEKIANTDEEVQQSSGADSSEKVELSSKSPRGKYFDAEFEYCNAAQNNYNAQYKECINALIEGYNSVRIEKGLPAINVKVLY